MNTRLRFDQADQESRRDTLRIRQRPDYKEPITLPKGHVPYNCNEINEDIKIKQMSGSECSISIESNSLAVNSPDTNPPDANPPDEIQNENVSLK